MDDERKRKGGRERISYVIIREKKVSIRVRIVVIPDRAEVGEAGPDMAKCANPLVRIRE